MNPNSHLKNLPSLFFAGLVLLFALLAKNEGADFNKRAFDTNVATTNLVASLPPAVLDVPEVSVANLPPPSVSAAVALIEDLDKGRDIFILNQDQQWPLASLTKLMTAIVTLEKVGKDQKVVMTSGAIAAEGDGGNFRVGEIFSAQDLIKAMVSVSSNDAAVAIAEFSGPENFVAAMQAKAQELEMAHTTFQDPAGLNLANQTTIRDLEKLVSYIRGVHPEIFIWSATKKLEITELKSKIKRILTNINKFAGQPDFLGGKTGYLDEANGNLVSLFKYRNQSVLIIVLGAADRFQETEKLWTYYKSLEF